MAQTLSSNLKRIFAPLLLLIGGVHAAAVSPVLVSSIASLRALAPGAYASVELQGYYSAGDGGGGTLYWDGTSTAAPDSCLTYKPSSNPTRGRWVRRDGTFIKAQWCGAYGDGTHDDTQVLAQALTIAHNQYVGTGLDLGSGQYVFSHTLVIKKRVTGNGFRLLPSGDGSGFDSSYYTRTTVPASIPRVNAAIVIQDGGVFEGGTIQVTDANVDRAANQGKWIVNLESNFGKNPLYNMRIDGLSSARNLGAVIVRYNTTCTIGPFGGSYWMNGLYVDATNISTFQGIFFEFIKRGGSPFYFTNSSDNVVQSCWTEGAGNNLIGFQFSGVSRYTLQGIKVGDPDGGSTLTGTSNAGTDRITQDADYTLQTNDRIRFDVAPGGLNTSTFYYVVNATGTDYQVSLTSGGAAIDITTSVAVTVRSAMQSACTFTSCDRIQGVRLSPENGAAFVGGTTVANGSSVRLFLDDTYALHATSYGMAAEFQYKIPQPVVFRNINLADTSVMRFLGRVTAGARITFTLVAKTSGFSGTDGKLNLWKLTGLGYALKGTITPSSGGLTSIGNVVTLTWDQDATETLYIAPSTPAGGGLLDVVADWNPVSGQ